MIILLWVLTLRILTGGFVMGFMLLAGGFVVVLIPVVIAVVSSVVSAVAASQDIGEDE